MAIIFSLLILKKAFKIEDKHFFYDISILNLMLRYENTNTKTKSKINQKKQI